MYVRVSGGGGSSGSATLDRLMDKIPFGPKPKIVDLTSDRKLADKVCVRHAQSCAQSCSLPTHKPCTAYAKLYALPVHHFMHNPVTRRRVPRTDSIKIKINILYPCTIYAQVILKPTRHLCTACTRLYTMLTVHIQQHACLDKVTQLSRHNTERGDCH